MGRAGNTLYLCWLDKKTCDRQLGVFAQGEGCFLVADSEVSQDAVSCLHLEFPCWPDVFPACWVIAEQWSTAGSSSEGFCPNDLRGGHCLSDFLFSIGHPASFLLLVLSICCFRIVRPWCCLLCVLFCAIALCVHE